MSERRYWDTCAWIDLVNELATQSGPMRTMWGAVERGALEVLFSPVTLVECLFKETPDQPRPFADPNPRDKLFDAVGAIPVQVDRAIGEKARTLRRRLNLGAPDAIHLACAIEHNVAQLVTRDGGVLTKIGGLYRKDGAPLIISTPAQALGGPLFRRA